MPPTTPNKTANFYQEVFGLEEARRIDNPNAKGYMLTDGHINLTILDFQSDAAADERGKDYEGIHHFGFEVENLEEMEGKLAAAGSAPMDRINNAMHANSDHSRTGENVEYKYTGPNGEMIDISQAGWSGAH